MAEARIQVRRIYDDVASDDGKRVLVDRLWPRGVSKEDAALDDWAKDVAPSDDLRKWYDHDVDRFDEFCERYRQELDDDERAAVVDDLVAASSDGTVTLLTATKDVEHSQAVVLAEVVASAGGGSWDGLDD